MGRDLRGDDTISGDNNTNSSRHKGSQRQTQADAAEPDEASSSHWKWRNSVNTKHAPLYHVTFIFVSFIFYIDQLHCNILTFDHAFRDQNRCHSLAVVYRQSNKETDRQRSSPFSADFND